LESCKGGSLEFRLVFLKFLIDCFESRIKINKILSVSDLPLKQIFLIAKGTTFFIIILINGLVVY
jgi:hypothetical protein